MTMKENNGRRSYSPVFTFLNQERRWLWKNWNILEVKDGSNSSHWKLYTCQYCCQGLAAVDEWQQAVFQT